MYRNVTVIMVVAIAFLGISINAVAADSTQLKVKPVSPASKIKAPASIALPSPAPAPVVEPTPTKSVPDVAPKPKPSLTTTPKPVNKLPAPKQISPTPAPSKAPAVSSLPKVKPTGPAASLPQGVQQNMLPAIKVPKDLGRSTQIPGGAGRELSRTNNLGSRLPKGHNSPTGGFRGGAAAGIAIGIGSSDGIPSVKDGLDTPVPKTGKGGQRQGYDTGEVPYTGSDASGWEHIEEGGFDSKEPGDEITFTEEESLEDLGKSDAWDDVFLNPEDDEEISDEEIEENISQHAHETEENEEKESQPPEGIDPSSERTVEGDPGDGNTKGEYVNTDKVKGIFDNAGGVRMAPGEEPNEGGMVNPELLGVIQSSQTQVKTFDGINATSNLPGNLGERAQDALSQGGPGTTSIQNTK